MQKAAEERKRTASTRSETHTRLKTLQQLPLSRTHRLKRYLSLLWTADRAPRQEDSVSINMAVFILEVSPLPVTSVSDICIMLFQFSGFESVFLKVFVKFVVLKMKKKVYTATDLEMFGKFPLQKQLN